MDINFELYKIFYHAATSESFSQASAKLFVSQSAVSQAIANLEQKTGRQLFTRKSKRICLTPEGELLFRHIEQAYNFIKAGENKLSELSDLKAGEIRIGASDTVCKYNLVSHLKQFYSAFPSIKINVVNRTSVQITEALKNGQIDIGIVTLPVQDKNIDVRLFISVEDIFTASDRFSELKGSKITLKNLQDYPLLLLHEKSATRRNLDLFLRQHDILITPEIELESVDLLVFC